MKHRSGDIRVVTRFLFFPKTLGGETRWLEWAKITQVFLGLRYGSGWWEDSSWAS
jgi:hypothetical protein